MTDPSTDRTLAAAIRVVARGDERDAILLAILEQVAARFSVGSAAVVLSDAASGAPQLVATFGLGPDAAAGLSAAMENANHPVRVTAATGVAGFDVRPMNPGGPALRTHLPLVVRHQDADAILGVLALAHDRPLAVEGPLLEAFADLLAIAVAYAPTG